MNENETNLSINIDAKLYPLEAITKTSRKYVENFNIEIFDNEETINITFSSKDKNKLMFEDLRKDFINEVILQTVRYNIFKQTKTIREMIIGRALYQTCVHYKQSS